MGAPCEYVEYELRPVYDLELGDLAQFPHLGGGKLLVEDKYGRVLLKGLYDELFYLASSHEVLGVELIEPLTDHVQDDYVVRPREFLQFFEGFHLRVLRLGGDAHEYRPLPLVRDIPRNGAAHLLFERCGEDFSIDVKGVEGP